MSIHDPVVLDWLDRQPPVRALLDSADGRRQLGSAGLPKHRRVRLDEAAVLLATGLGRDLTRACSLALHDRNPTPTGIRYRSHLDLDEVCWALYDHAEVTFGEAQQLSPTVPTHADAVRRVAALWGIALPAAWRAS